MRAVLEEVESIGDRARGALRAKSQAREAGLTGSRDTIRFSANAIRAVHRGEFDRAEMLVSQAAERLTSATDALAEHPDILHAGFVHDGAKEYAEARITLALVRGEGSLPSPEDLDVALPAYLNGLGEAVGELRRYLLDQLASGEVEACRQILRAMDDIYGVLVTVDFPDAMTGGLRRTTDNVRGILERTRGDLALALRQSQLEERLGRFEQRLEQTNG